MASTLCELSAFNEISIETSKLVRNNYMKEFKNNRKDYQVSKDGFNYGLLKIIKLEEKYKICNLLKIK